MDNHRREQYRARRLKKKIQKGTEWLNVEGPVQSKIKVYLELYLNLNLVCLYLYLRAPEGGFGSHQSKKGKVFYWFSNV